jgi:hypothetical protein
MPLPLPDFNVTDFLDGQLDRGGYVLAIFLILIALLSATVATFTLTSITNLRDARQAHGQEVAYQMARTGLDFWMNRIREDWALHFSDTAVCTGENNSDPSPPTNRKEYCSDFTKRCSGASFSMSRRKAYCCDYGNIDDEIPSVSSLSSAQTHPWGWGSDIIVYYQSEFFTLGYDMGDRIFLPGSASTWRQSDDFGYFEIIKVEDAKGEFSGNFDNDNAPDPTVSCRNPNNQNSTGINVNTASYSHLRQVDYQVNPDKHLTHEMVMALIEHRSGSEYDISEGDTFPLHEEVYNDYSADTFTSPGEVCDVLASVDDYFQSSTGCDGKPYNGGIWGYTGKNKDRNHLSSGLSSSGTFCATIEGGKIEDLGDTYSVTNKQRIHVKVSRPSSSGLLSNCSGDIQIMSIEEL